MFGMNENAKIAYDAANLQQLVDGMTLLQRGIHTAGADLTRAQSQK